MSWALLTVAPDGSHHTTVGGPAYSERFDEVLKFHAPGLAPVRRRTDAWHIRTDGSAAYPRRFARTFGFYEGLAAVVGQDGCHHITPAGDDAYTQRYAWCGNFQGGRCAVREADGSYLHIAADGRPVYAQRWRYAGDYRDGIAVVQATDGRSTHVDLHGQELHGRWFIDLDVFHKGFARARDRGGWHHINLAGRPVYARRFAAVEPFYNGQARVEADAGTIEVIDEVGRTIRVLRGTYRADDDLVSNNPAHRLAREGFALVSNVFEPHTVSALTEAIAEIVAGNTSPDLLRAGDGHVRKITYPLNKHPAFLRALAHPKLLGLALQLCPDPENIVLTWEDVLLKPARCGLAVPVHQDIALQSVSGGVFSLGIHLDDASENPPRFLPRSHLHGPLTRLAIRRLAAAGKFEDVGPCAGDVLAHDVLVVHESGPNTGPRPRSTWYLEFRTRAQLRRDGPWAEEWVEHRRALLFHAAAARVDAGMEVAWPPCGPNETRESWLARPCLLRVPHLEDGVGYDSSSPYYHFA